MQNTVVKTLIPKMSQETRKITPQNFRDKDIFCHTPREFNTSFEEKNTEGENTKNKTLKSTIGNYSLLTQQKCMVLYNRHY